MSLVAGVTVPPEVVVLVDEELVVVEVLDVVDELEVDVLEPPPPDVGESLPPPQAAKPTETREITAHKRIRINQFAFMFSIPRKTIGTLGLYTLPEKYEQIKRAP
jgi:hypothetical protein